MHLIWLTLAKCLVKQNTVELYFWWYDTFGSSIQIKIIFLEDKIFKNFAIDSNKLWIEFKVLKLCSAGFDIH